MTRVVQVSDTHLSHLTGVPASVRTLLDWIDADPPDLLIHSGDIVYDDPDDDDDRAFARRVFEGLPCDVLAIPGNHDIGFYGEDERRAERIEAFCAAWGADRFSVDIDGWRLVGANAYLLGDPAHDTWLRASVVTDRPVALFIHQPLGGDPEDGWEMPRAARDAFDRVAAGADIRLVASGHRHCSYDGDRIVWAPSTTILGETFPGTDPRVGAVEYTLMPGGGVATRFVRPEV